MKSDCCNEPIVKRYPVMKDGYSLGKGYNICSKCRKQIKPKKEEGNET